MEIDVVARIDGTEYRINEVEVDYSLCKSKGSATFIMDESNYTNFNTFADVEIEVNGERIFTGFVEEKQTTDFPHKGAIVANCEIIKAERTWLTSEKVSSGQSASYWINYFIDYADISNKSVQSYGTTVYEGHSWAYQAVNECLSNLAQLVDARFYPDRNGTVHFRDLKTEGVDFTIDYYSDKVLTYTNNLCRNKAVVFGYEVTAIVSGSNPYMISGETRAIAVSSSLIQTQATANAVASKLLSTFNKPLEVLSYRIEGEATLSLNDYVSAPDGSGAITSLKHEISENTFTTVVTIGEICPNFFGLDIIEEVIPLYLSTIGNGVWKSGNGTDWTDISGTALAGKTVPAIHHDGTYLWAISGNSIYRGAGGSSWTSCNILPTFTDGDLTISRSNLVFKDIITNYEDSSKVFVVAHDTESSKIVVLISNDLLLFDRMVVIK